MDSRTQPGPGRGRDPRAARSNKRSPSSRRERLLTLKPRKLCAPARTERPPARRATSRRPRPTVPRSSPPTARPTRPKTPPPTEPKAPPATEPTVGPDAAPETPQPPWLLRLLVVLDGVQFFWLFCLRPQRHYLSGLSHRPELAPVLLSLLGGVALIFVWNRCRWGGWIVLLVNLLEVSLLRPYSCLTLLYAAWALTEPAVVRAWRGARTPVAPRPGAGRAPWHSRAEEEGGIAVPDEERM